MSTTSTLTSFAFSPSTISTMSNRTAADLPTPSPPKKSKVPKFIIDLTENPFSDDEDNNDDLTAEIKSTNFKYCIEGNPVPMSRPRVSKKTGGVFYPSNIKAHKRKIQSEFKLCYAYLREKRPGKVLFPKGTLVQMRVVFHLRRPLSHFQKRQRNMFCIKDKLTGLSEALASSHKDVDNLAKMVMDAANGILYHDDSQVVKLTVEKRFDSEGHCEGRTEVHISVLND